MASRYKGLVLAAGFGTRLRPLTDYYPKPLVPFAGTNPLSIAIAKLENIGIKDIAINSHYHANQIADVVNSIQRANTSLALYLSFEPEILGTGGALNPLRSWLGDAPLVIINGDVVSTVSLVELIKTHENQNACASMALLPSVIAGESAVYHRDGLIKSISKSAPLTGATPGNFACAQVITKKFLDLIPKQGAFDIISKGYLPAIAADLSIASFVHDGYWHDLGTPKSYLRALLNIFDMPAHSNKGRLGSDFPSTNMNFDSSQQTLIHPDARISSQAKVGRRTVIEAGAVIGDNSVVTESIILPGANISAGETIHRMIIGSDFRLNVSLD
jgi:NDP-sugar pyrophosphorylase family protein